MLRAANRFRLASVRRTPEVLGSRHDAAGAQLGGSLWIRSQADLRGAGNGRDGRLAFLQALGLVEIGDAFLGHDVGDVVAVNHDRRDRHSRLLAHRDGV